MPLEHHFACPLPNGLHARPASHLEAVASRFNAAATLRNERNGNEADLKSVLALIASDIRHGDPLCLRVEGGSDEANAFAALRHFVDAELAGTDHALPEVDAGTATVRMPPSLRACAPAGWLTGQAACRGVAEGVVVLVGGLGLAAQYADAPADSPEAEQARFERAVDAAQARLETTLALARGVEAEVLKAHLSLVRDATLRQAVSDQLRDHGGNAARAVLAAVEEFGDRLRRSESAYLRERALDLQDIGASLLTELHGPDAVVRVPALERPSVVVSESLTPGQFLALDRRYLQGVVLQHAGATSHTVILARAAGLPTLTGVQDALALRPGSPIILDANLGLLLPEPNEGARRYYALEGQKIARQRAAASVFRDTPGRSRDGRELRVLANVSSAAEVAEAVRQGAQGIGLFRTEMLYMDRETPPSEEEQTEIYSAAAREAQGRPVILRTFDIGGDKPVPYLNLPAEPNPFLGSRGARIYGEFSALLTVQLRAAFRAAAHGRILLMAPMIACAEEMRAFRAVVETVRADFPGVEVPVGVMLEIPSAVFAVPELARDADFFSLGTNDLAQYFLAADRDNGAVAELHAGFHPSFLRLLRLAVEQAAAHGRPIGLCGELGENPTALPLLLGLGLNSISMGASRVLATKAALARLDATACTALLHEAAATADRREVEACLSGLTAAASNLPLLSVDTIVTEASSVSKHEAIKELVDLLAADGRLGDGVEVEEAVWKREEAYSTGFGYGFAVPHCQSAQVTANSLALIRLKEPVDWGSLDGNPVRVVILLAIRASEHGKEHLKIFSRLSRLVMRDAFREQLEQAADAQGIFSVLSAELQLPSN